MKFLDKIKMTLTNDMNQAVTENGAMGYRTTGKHLLDMHFATASLRGVDAQEIINMFVKAYYEDKKMALKWLFYARDVRGGLGERRVFRIVLQYLAKNNREIHMQEVIELIPTYGRFDDLFILLDTPYCDAVIEFLNHQLESDLEACRQNKSISLAAKWLPSINASSEKTRERGKMFASKLGMSEREYRKVLSTLRSYLNLVECKMSGKQFGEIAYEAVPSKANLIYRNAFMRHDVKRRKEYLLSLQKGNTKIHSGTLFPHEIVHAYMAGYSLGTYDETLEELWRTLDNKTEYSSIDYNAADCITKKHNTINCMENTIIVADGSGSMMTSIGGGTCTALSVANALAIYFSERSSGRFKNQYITFSSNPQLVDLSNGESLHEKLQIALAYNEVANTDIYKVFRLILKTALIHRMKQWELPKNIVIISDMEFDGCAENASETLFHQIGAEYKSYGYKIPRLVFWNVNSRTRTIPVKENALGVALVSGFSINIFNMIVSNELDPYKSLLAVLNTPRYEAVDSFINKIL
ncbi:hypothetical protein acsn021_30590 [Anaerocolumna cellulosilytica]|uniref:DUF2828 domain-containing protein n=1 Tax=Anaerocolumna cellulosilytica TaxID=433286 RepID=A0A6S6R7P5_9FIRM|nr:DUF2828 family protein [Anaerocolumna cellulosilytica]MBB5197471.1 hypothetical protein [Anaerocolumna cellulosilytica]BCJ95490.1 hypothetical protein acsn021_30590 [Anaerocolumna cellulosilytica]